MRLRLLAWLTGLALAGVLLAPTAGLATETETVHFSGTNSLPWELYCSGVTGTVTIDFNGVLHTTTLDDGTYHVTGTRTTSFVFVPDDPSQPTYTGHDTNWFGENVNRKNFTITAVSTEVAHGSDGSMFKAFLLFHLTVNPDGTVTTFVEVERFDCP
jgi:hypothetical protein